MDPCKSETGQDSSIKLARGDYVVGKLKYLNFGKNRPNGFFPAYIREMYTLRGIFYFFIFLGGGSSTRVQPTPLNRFSRAIHQNTCFRIR